MDFNEHKNCYIDFIDETGKGVSLKDNVRLSYTLPGETVEYYQHNYRKEKKTYLNKVISASHERIIPKCKYFGTCGGCNLQHLSKNLYKDFKLAQIRNALANENINTQLNDLIIIEEGQRRRANLEVIKKEGKIYLGFHRAQSHQIINIDSCPAMMKELSDLIIPLKELFNNLLADFQKAHIYLTFAANGIDLTIRPFKPLTLNVEKNALLKNFANCYEIIRLKLHNSKTIGFLHESAKPYILLDGDIKVDIEAHGFLQSSFASDQILQELVVKNFKTFRNPEDNMAVDLFCGRGTYTFALSKFCNVHGFDNAGEGLESLRKAVTASLRPIDVSQRDLFTFPLKPFELNNYQFAVINPPRSGAPDQIGALAKSHIKNVVYISCNPKTFTSDAKNLIKGGFNLISTTPLDQFYWNHHLEVVGLFTRL